MMKARKRVRRARWPLAVSAGAAVAALALCWSRMGTWVTGEDPFVYFSLARRLIDTGFSREALGELAGFVAPVFPLAVTAITLMAGPGAVYGAQWLAWIALIVVASRWASGRLADQPAAIEAWLGLMWPLLLLSGHATNPHFLMLPFRETTALLAAVLALTAWEAARRRGSGWGGVGAGVLACLAAGIREPVALAMAGSALYALGRVVARRESPLPLLGLASVPAAVGVIMAASFAAGLWRPNFQVRLWWTSLTAGNAGERYLARLAETTAWLPDELGWLGAVAAIWGIARLIRRPEALFALALPAAAFLLFHAGYTPHRRYFLMTLFFVAPLAAYGAFDAGRGLLRLLAPTRRRVSAAVGWIGLVALLVSVCLQVRPWGPRASLAEVRLMKILLADIPDQRIGVDPRCRQLVDAIVTYTDKMPVNPADDVSRWVVSGSGWWIRPLNDAALYPPGAYIRHARAGTIGEHFGRFDADPARPRSFSFGEARFDVLRWRPWTSSSVTERVSAPGPDAVLWLDFRGGITSDSPARVTLVAGDATVWSGDLPPHGWQPVVLPRGAGLASDLVVRVDHPAGLPERVVGAVQRGGRSVRFPLLEARSLSTDAWVLDLEAPRPQWRFAFPLRFANRLRVPLPAQDGPERWMVRLLLHRRGGAAAPAVRVEVSSPALSAPVAADWPAGHDSLPIELAGPMPATESRGDGLVFELDAPAHVGALVTEVHVRYDWSPP